MSNKYVSITVPAPFAVLIMALAALAIIMKAIE